MKGMNPYLVARFCGLEIIESPHLTVAGDPVQVRRTWRQRLFSRPWRPWVATYTTIPQVPDPNAYRMGGKLVMHPETLRALKAMLNAPSSRPSPVPAEGPSPREAEPTEVEGRSSGSW